MAVGLSSQEWFLVRKWRAGTVLALFSAAGNREWTDHLPSKTSNTYVMISETNLENGVNGTQTYGEGSSPARQLEDSSRYLAVNKLLHRGGLEGGGHKKIIGESGNATLRACHLEMDIGNDCCKYGLRREGSR